MRSGANQDIDGGRRITVSLIIGYVLGLASLAFGLLFMFISFIGGLLLALAGVWLLPPVRRRILARTNLSVTRGVVALIALVLLISGTGIVFAELLTPSEEFQSFKEDIEAEGVDIEAIGEEDRRWVLEYYPTSGSGEDRLAELGTIAILYAENVPSAESAPDHRSLDLILLRADGNRLGSMSIDAETARAYSNGQITREEYLTQVAMRAMFG